MSKTTRIISLPGTKVSALKSLLLTSSGIITLDPIIGGGLPVGTITLLEEDEGCTYSKIILKSFLSEGLSSNHPLFIATQKVSPNSLAKELMPAIDLEMSGSSVHTSTTEDELKIAWRYQNNPQVESAMKSSSTFGHVYDLSRTIDESKLDEASINYFPEDSDKFSYEELYSAIESVILEKHHVDNPKLRTVLRIGLQGLGTNLWSGDLVLFMFKLQNLVKSSYACVLITISSHLMEPFIVSRCEHLSDIVLKLDTLPSGEKDDYLNEYHGLFHLVKQCSLNSLGVFIPDSNDWGFKLKRRRFLIEKLHLPPELQESKQREQDDIVSCGSSGSKKSSALDF